MRRSKLRKRTAALMLAFVMAVGLLPISALADPAVTVRIIGQNGVIEEKTLSISSVTDYTKDANDQSAGLNALDAVISATQLDSLGSYGISYNSTYKTYYISKIAGITPSASDYWGSLSISQSGAYDGNALSGHALAAGDTYIVYYDRYTGRGGNYGYQSYACFDSGAVSGKTGTPVEVSVKTTGYDAGWNTVAAPLSYVTVYASGGSYNVPTPVALTDGDGKACISFAEAGSYTLSLSEDYTYARCAVSVSGSPVSLSGLKITVTNSADNLNGASLTLTNDSGDTYSAYAVSPSVYLYKTGYSSIYRVDSSVYLYLAGSNANYTVSPTVYLYSIPDGTYNYSVTANGCQPASGTVTVSGATSKIITLAALSGRLVTITPGDAAHETVKVTDSSGAEQTASSISGGVYSYDLPDGNYTYIISRSGYHSRFGSFTVNGTGQSIAPAALTEAASGTAAWPAFRSFGSNMAVVADSTARGSWQASEKWASSLGALGAYGTLTTSNIVVYDGYLYVATEHGLSKVKKSDGTVVATVPLSTSGTTYAPQIAYGDGKIFAANSKGIDAYDALTMERVWSSPISSYGNYMPTTPILYSAGTNTIYVGDFGDSNYTLGTYGGYSAINASDGSGKWIKWGGATDSHYWAGAVIVGDYLVFGSDSGTLSSVKASDASAAGTLSVTGKIRSSAAYDGTCLYFTTSSGYIYKASIDSATGALTLVASRQFCASGSTSTPVVYNGRVYVGANDGIYVLSASDLTQVSSYTTSGGVQSSALLTTAYSGSAYGYFTVNSPRGEIVVLKDDGAGITYDTLYTASHEQYSYTSLVSDGDGTIYYTNDSGYIFAISNTGANSADKAKVTFNITPPSVFDSNSWTTTYPAITVRDESGAVVNTASAGTYYLPAGNYAYTVGLSGYSTASGSFTISSGDIGGKTISVSLSPLQNGNTNTNISVSVTVTGYNGEGLLNSKTVTLQNGATAWEAIQTALSGSGISCATKSTQFGIYIVSVNGLAEFDKGPNSGWEYTVNGTKPSVGVSVYTMSSGDNLVLYYTADYTAESTAAVQGGTAQAEITASQNSSTGMADATLSGTALTSFIAALSSGGDTEGSKAVITVAAPAGAAGTNVTIPQSAVSAVSEKNSTSLSIETGVGALTFDPKAVDAISGSSGGVGVTVSISKSDASSLSDENKSLVGDHPVYNLSVTAGSKSISSFGGGSVTVSIPYEPKAGEDTSKLAVYYIGSDGKAIEMEGAYYDAASGSIVFTTNHFSSFAIVYGRQKSFADVGESDWFFAAVKYVSQRGLMEGVTSSAFGPDSEMTRAMLVTVLYRMEGKPAVSAQNGFSDVKEGEWYTEAVKWASANKIAAGYGSGAFGTYDSVTREQMAAVLYNYSKHKGYDVNKSAALSSFSDTAELSSWAENAMKWAVSEGLINGTSADRLSPKGTATRAQVATILMRFNEHKAK